MKHFTSFLFFLCSIIPCCLAQQSNPIQEEIANYNYEKALQLIDKEKPNVQNQYQKALILKGLNRFWEAINTLQELYSKTPENQRLIIELAECCKLSGKYNEALQWYEKALIVNPENKYAQIQYINLLYLSERYKDAYMVCSEILQNDSSATILRLMGQIHIGLKDLIQATNYYKKVTEVEPDDNSSVARLANLYINMDDPENAITITESYRKRDTTNIYVNRQNAQAYCLTQDYDKAIERYRSLVHKGDSSMFTCYYLGMSYYATDKFYDAHDFLKKAYEYDPKNVNVLYYFGRSCSKTSWKEEGIQYLNDALKLVIPSDSTLTKLYAGLADCYKFGGQVKNMAETLKEQYKYDKMNHRLLYRIGSIYQDDLKDNKNAERYLKMYLKTRPKEDVVNDSHFEKGGITVGESSFYNAAEKRLEAIRKDQFFNGDI